MSPDMILNTPSEPRPGGGVLIHRKVRIRPICIPRLSIKKHKHKYR